MESSSGKNSQPAKGVSRILLKLESNLAEGNFYEAHQLYKTLSYRLTNQSKYGEAIDILHTGASKLLEHNQTESGADLAMSLLDVLNKLGKEEKEHYINQLGVLHSLLPPEAVERRHFISKAIKCTKTPTKSAGSPDLHKALAQTLWKEQRHSEARYHFLYATDGENCGKFLIEFHHNCGGHPYEVDLFVAQMVLQLLCLKNTSSASVTFYAYVNNHPDVARGPPFLLPLLNFLWFLLLAINDGKLSVFAVLCEKYQRTLSRDPLYRAYLDKIGQNFFGIPAPEAPSGLFGGLLNSLFSDMAEDNEQPINYNPNSSQSMTSSDTQQPTRTFESSDLD